MVTPEKISLKDPGGICKILDNLQRDRWKFYPVIKRE